MGSRLRENPEHIYECFLEVSLNDDPSKGPEVVSMIPKNELDSVSVKTIPKFCFPCRITEKRGMSNAVQLFTFVLTDIESQQKLGFCRQTPDGKTCLCVVSFLPWFEVFYKLLNILGEMHRKNLKENMELLLESIYSYKLPNPGENVTINTSNSNISFTFSSPDMSKLPMIPENRNLTEYSNAVKVFQDPINMMKLFASLLYERRVIVTSQKLTLLTAIVHGASSLLYPLYWQHIFVPVMPSHLTEYCCAPMPYFIGVHSSMMPDVYKMIKDDDIVVLNADTNTIESPFDDLSTLPNEVVTSLKTSLKKGAKELGDGIARAFLRALVPLIGGYRLALKLKMGEKITFDEEIYLQSHNPNMRPFLEKMLHLQHFQQFIEGRLNQLNAGKGFFSDEFEVECNNFEIDKNNKFDMYSQWLSSMKKDGKAFLKNVQRKANPAMRLMYQQAKSGLKEVSKRFQKSKETDDLPSSLEQRPTGLLVSSTVTQRSAPCSPSSSPTPTRSQFTKPAFPTVSSTSPKSKEDTTTITHCNLIELDEPEIVNLDLMNDFDEEFKRLSIRHNIPIHNQRGVWSEAGVIPVLSEAGATPVPPSRTTSLRTTHVSDTETFQAASPGKLRRSRVLTPLDRPPVAPPRKSRQANLPEIHDGKTLDSLSTESRRDIRDSEGVNTNNSTPIMVKLPPPKKPPRPSRRSHQPVEQTEESNLLLLQSLNQTHQTDQTDQTDHHNLTKNSNQFDLLGSLENYSLPSNMLETGHVLRPSSNVSGASEDNSEGSSDPFADLVSLTRASVADDLKLTKCSNK